MLEEYEHKKSESAHHSQLNQDGIIEEIFNRIGTTNKFFIEFGSRLPWMLNSSYLRHHKQWTGLMFDASDGKANFFEKRSWRQYRRDYFSSEADWHEAVKGFELIKKNTLINSTNINNVFNSYDAPSVFDLLSIDIDGQDYWAWEGLDESRFKPRVVSIEFDFSLGSQDSLVEPKDEGAQGSSWPPCMCSLKALDELAKSKGYSYVYSLRPHEIFYPSRMAGTHAFFVLNEELNDNLRAQELFQYKKESVEYRNHTRQNSKCKFVQGSKSNIIWPYLKTKDMMARQRVAAHYAEEYKNVVEIGGWTNNVSQYLDLNKHESVTVIDPLLEDSKRGGLTYIKGLVLDLPEDLVNKDCCLIALGFGLQFGDVYERRKEINYITKLANKAGMVILEYADGYAEPGRGKMLLSRLYDSDNLKFQSSVEFDFDRYGEVNVPKTDQPQEHVALYLKRSMFIFKSK